MFENGGVLFLMVLFVIFFAADSAQIQVSFRSTVDRVDATAEERAVAVGICACFRIVWPWVHAVKARFDNQISVLGRECNTSAIILCVIMSAGGPQGSLEVIKRQLKHFSTYTHLM